MSYTQALWLTLCDFWRIMPAFMVFAMLVAILLVVDLARKLARPKKYKYRG